MNNIFKYSLIIALLVLCGFVFSYSTVYNPFTGKLDYVDGNNFSGNLTINGTLTVYGNTTSDVQYFNTVTVNPSCRGCIYRNGTGLVIVG